MGIKINWINKTNGLGEYEMMMSQKNKWNKEFAKEASLASINFCFPNLRILKITLAALSINKIANILYAEALNLMRLEN